MPRSRVFRAVRRYVLRCGCTGFILHSRSYWWELQLDCGHVEERRIRYKKGSQRYYGPYHPRECPDEMTFENCYPPPRTALCYACSREQEKAT